MNADANRHTRGEVVDVNFGNKQRGSGSEQMVASLMNNPERNGPVPLRDVEGKRLALVLRDGASQADAPARTTMRKTPRMGGLRLVSIVPEAPVWKTASRGSTEADFEWAAEALAAPPASNARKMIREAEEPITPPEVQE